MNPGFEAILWLYSIMIGLGISKVLEGVKNHVVSGQTLRGNTLYVGMLAMGLLVHVTSWLSLWSLRNVETWSALSFLLVLTIPLLLYLFSSVAVPDDPPSPNMNAYYLRNATRMHGLLIMTIGFNGLADLLMLGSQPDITVNLVRLAIIALLSACALKPGAIRLHKVIVPALVMGIAALVPFLEFPIK